MFLVLAASLFFTDAAPLDMPRAEAYLCKDGARLYLEDRYNRMDLWTSRTVLGRWMDDEGRIFTLSELDMVPPAVETNGTVTRVTFSSEAVPLGLKNVRGRKQAIACLSPLELPEEPQLPHQKTPHFKNVEYWQGTNTSALVCAFRPEKSPVWYLASWELADNDVFDDRQVQFEEKFLPQFEAAAWSAWTRPAGGEREELRADALHSVTNYASWHFSSSSEFVVLDDLPKSSAGFVNTLTNELPQLRARYVAVCPTPLDGSNVLAVARIYATREEFLSVAGESMQWSAAFWCPSRRELIAYLPETGEKELMKTIRHEAFHQYLSYALSMITASPWINEGYAQYFEDEETTDWELGAGNLSLQNYEQFATLLPTVLDMDYEQFYAGTDEERRLKYRLAWSVAVFLEKGAPKVRFEPFKTLKADYFEALLKTHDMHEATKAAFGSADRLKLFVSEWLKFWKE